MTLPLASAAHSAAAVVPSAIGAPIEVFATGLVNPRGLVFRLDRTLLVVEAGTGGPKTVDGHAPGGGNASYGLGRTGRLSSFLPDGDRSILARDLPSLVTASGAVLGPSAVATLGERSYVRLDFGGAQTDDPEYRDGLLLVRADGSSERALDLPLVGEVSPGSGRHLTPAGERAEAASGLFALEGRLYVTDAAGRQLLQVRPTGETSKVAAYSSGQRTPVAIASGSDGTLYVAEIAPDQVIRIAPDGDLAVAATGLRDPIGLAVDRTGALYVLEAAGRVVRAHLDEPSESDLVADGLVDATSLTAGPDGNLYVAIGGRGSAGGEGQVVRLRLVSRSDPRPRQILVAANWGLGLAVFAVALAIGHRFRERGARPPPPEPKG